MLMEFYKIHPELVVISEHQIDSKVDFVAITLRKLPNNIQFFIFIKRAQSALLSSRA
jgi:hypothetical protein